MKNRLTKTITVNKQFNFGVFRKERTFAGLGFNAFGFIFGVYFHLQPIPFTGKVIGFRKSDGFTNYCLYLFNRLTIVANYPRLAKGQN